MKYLGFGEFEGKCNNEAGTPWTPYWCNKCDELRRNKLSKSLQDIQEKFKSVKEINLNYIDR